MKEKLNELTTDELDRSLRDTKAEIRAERFKSVTSRVENPKKSKELRKRIARILTLKREYVLGKRTIKG